MSKSSANHSSPSGRPDDDDENSGLVERENIPVNSAVLINANGLPNENHSMPAASSNTCSSKTGNEYSSCMKQQLGAHKGEAGQGHIYHRSTEDDFIMVNKDDTNLVFIATENLSAHNTQDFGIGEHESMHFSASPATPSLPPPSQNGTTDPSTLLPNHHLTADADTQMTQAAVECDGFVSEESAQLEFQPKITNSSSSTNSSTDDEQYLATNELIGDENRCIQLQRSDLTRIKSFEVKLDNDRKVFEKDLGEDSSNLDTEYDATVRENNKLKEELTQLTERRNRVCSQWSCPLCTFLNEPFIKTGRDVCDICGGPSPQKRHNLINSSV